jgi:putative oxidoreductase
MGPAQLDAAATFAGRVLLSAIFLHEAYAKLTAYAMSQAYMRAFGVPPELLPLAITVESVCGLLILVGYRTRIAALVLAGFCIAAAFLFHTKLGDRNQLHFEKDLAIAGGFLVLFAHGGGAWAVDAWRGRGGGGLTPRA